MTAPLRAQGQRTWRWTTVDSGSSPTISESGRRTGASSSRSLQRLAMPS